MKRNLQVLATLLLLAGMSLASPFDRDDRHKKRYPVPEPGALMLVSLTGVTLAGAFLARRRFSANAAR